MAEMDGDKTDNGSTNLHELRVRRDSPVTGSRDAFVDMKNLLRDDILAHANPAIDLSDRTQARPYVHDCLDDLLDKKGIVLNRTEKRKLLDAIVADLINRPLP